MTKKTDVPQAKLILEDVYESHHERGNRYGFLYCHGERGLYLREWLGTGKRVLDLGCRDGTLTQYYVEGNHIMGADIDKKALAMAQEKYGIETVWLDLNAEFPFEKESFDAVVAGELLEHIYHTNRFLKNVFSILKPQGLFLGSVPNSFRMRNRFKFLVGKEFDKDRTHVHMFSYDRLTTLLSQYFRDILIVPIGGTILPFLKVSRRSPFFLNRLFGRDLLWKALK